MQVSDHYQCRLSFSTCAWIVKYSYEKSFVHTYPEQKFNVQKVFWKILITKITQNTAYELNYLPNYSPPICYNFKFNYHRWGKIHWATYSWFQRHRSFCRNTLHFLGHNAHYLVQTKRDTYIHGKNFVVLLKTVKHVKV